MRGSRRGWEMESRILPTSSMLMMRYLAGTLFRPGATWFDNTATSRSEKRTGCFVSRSGMQSVDVPGCSCDTSVTVIP